MKLLVTAQFAFKRRINLFFRQENHLELKDDCYAIYICLSHCGSESITELIRDYVTHMGLRKENLQYPSPAWAKC